MTPASMAALHARCFTMPRPWGACEFAALLSGPGTFLCAAEAGFALGRAVAGEAELLTLAVAPEQRRRGMGRALLARFEAEAAQRRAAIAHIEVAACNTAAQALYQGAGYTVTGRRPRYYHGPDGRTADALMLSRQLALPAPPGG